jgi:hypothetical protein
LGERLAGELKEDDIYDQSAIFDVSQFLVTRALTVLATELGLQWEHVAKSY